MKILMFVVLSILNTSSYAFIQYLTVKYANNTKINRKCETNKSQGKKRNKENGTTSKIER